MKLFVDSASFLQGVTLGVKGGNQGYVLYPAELSVSALYVMMELDRLALRLLRLLSLRRDSFWGCAYQRCQHESTRTGSLLRPVAEVLNSAVR